MIQTFSLWLPATATPPRPAELESLLAEALGGRPLRWAITACQPGRWLVEGAVIR